jgi:arsenate reductase
MAEGFARALRPGEFAPHSAGLSAHTLNPRAVEVMAEVGIDISRQVPKSIQSLLDLGLHFDTVYTVCAYADENCPTFPGTTQVIHRRFDDPTKLSQTAASDEEALAIYRRVRDQIREWIAGLAV